MSGARKVGLALAFCTGLAPAGWTQGDIQCYSTKAHLDLPTDCRSNCNVKPAKGENPLAHTDNYCGLEPRCAPLKDAELKARYNRSVPSLKNPTALGGLAAQKRLVAYIVDHFYSNGGRGFTSSDMDIQIGHYPTGDDWCALQREDLAPGQKRQLWVEPQTFDRSPGFLVSCVGHELIHLEQDRRPIPTSVKGITDIRDAFYELEAWTWESGDTNFAWRIGSSKVRNCRTQAERDEDACGINGYRLKISRYLEELNTTKRKYRGVFENWFSHDPWTSQWSRANPDWRRSPVTPLGNCKAR